MFFLALAFLLEETYAVYKVVSLILAILTILLLSSHLNVIADNYYCEIVVRNETITQGGNFTSYEYARECFAYDKNTAFSIFKLVNYFVRYLPVYIFVLLLYLGARGLGLDLLERVRDLFRK